jgi:hypothetical protein
MTSASPTRRNHLSSSSCRRRVAYLPTLVAKAAPDTQRRSLMSAALRSLAVLMLASSACSKSADRVVPPASAEHAVPLAEIASFDCGSSLPEKKGELVRAMQLGGPGGAAWNWDGGELACVVRVSLHCQAQPIVSVSAGDHEQSAQVSQPTPETAIATVTFDPAVWRASLERSAQPFAKLRMRARGGQLHRRRHQAPARCERRVQRRLRLRRVRGYAVQTAPCPAD